MERERCTTVKIAGDHEPEMLSEMAKSYGRIPAQVLAPKLGARFAIGAEHGVGDPVPEETQAAL